MKIQQWQKGLFLFAVFYTPLNFSMDALYTKEEKELNKKLYDILFSDKNWTQAKPEIKKLIIEGADPNQYEANPLFIATTMGDFLFVEWLLERGGANPYVASFAGTPYQYIQTLKGHKTTYPAHQKIEQLLIDYMKKPEIIQEYEGICAIKMESVAEASE